MFIISSTHRISAHSVKERLPSVLIFLPTLSLCRDGDVADATVWRGELHVATAIFIVIWYNRARNKKIASKLETGRGEGGAEGWGGPERRAIDREQLRRSRAPAILNPLWLVRYSSRLVPPGTPTFPFPHPFSSSSPVVATLTSASSSPRLSRYYTRIPLSIILVSKQWWPMSRENEPASWVDAVNRIVFPSMEFPFDVPVWVILIISIKTIK